MPSVRSLPSYCAVLSIWKISKCLDVVSASTTLDEIRCVSNLATHLNRASYCAMRELKHSADGSIEKGKELAGEAIHDCLCVLLCYDLP